MVCVTCAIFADIKFSNQIHCIRVQKRNCMTYETAAHTCCRKRKQKPLSVDSRKSLILEQCDQLRCHDYMLLGAHLPGMPV